MSFVLIGSVQRTSITVSFACIAILVVMDGIICIVFGQKYFMLFMAKDFVEID